MTSVNGFSADPHIAELLDHALRRLRAELAEGPAARFGLRGSHFRLLSMIPDDGARITDLAEAAAMSKQALGQFVDYLQKHGYVESVRSAADKRVRIVRRTARGTAARDAGLGAIARVEQAWRTELGDRRYAALRTALRDVGRNGDDNRDGQDVAIE